MPRKKKTSRNITKSENTSVSKKFKCHGLIYSKNLLQVISLHT